MFSAFDILTVCGGITAIAIIGLYIVFRLAMWFIFRLADKANELNGDEVEQKQNTRKE